MKLLPFIAIYRAEKRTALPDSRYFNFFRDINAHAPTKTRCNQPQNLCDTVVLRAPYYFRSPFVRDIPLYSYTASLYISKSRLSFVKFYTAYRYDDFRTVYYLKLRSVLRFVSCFFSRFVSLGKFRDRSLLLKIFELAFL